VDTDRFVQLATLGGLEVPQNIEFDISGPRRTFTNRLEVDEVSAVCLALTGAAALGLQTDDHGSGVGNRVGVDSRGAALATTTMFDRLNGKVPPTYTNETSDFFQCENGDWIHLHGGLPHLNAGTLAVLGSAGDRSSISRAVARWQADELEETLADAGMCAAKARSFAQWREHPQGKALSNVPVVEMLPLGEGAPRALPRGPRLLSGARVLEFARILAAPVCGRTLAEYGADVLNISSGHLQDLFQCQLTTGLGKRSSDLDLRIADQYQKARTLAETCDVFVNGYRTGSLDSRGFGPNELADRNPGIIYVSINCYGHEGPWVQRKGWEQLAQSASGLALAQGGDRPLKMPALLAGDKRFSTAPNDFITGFLGAYGAMVGLRRRALEGGSWWVRVSLCRTAMWLQDSGEASDLTSDFSPTEAYGYRQSVQCPYGVFEYLRSPVDLGALSPYYASGPCLRGGEEPVWTPLPARA
jgi:crotonobetainyl-CoA:carnitine CoA-transferase CaiB-like acyl-CoA transferase